MDKKIELFDEKEFLMQLKPLCYVPEKFSRKVKFENPGEAYLCEFGSFKKCAFRDELKRREACVYHNDLKRFITSPRNINNYNSKLIKSL